MVFIVYAINQKSKSNQTLLTAYNNKRDFISFETASNNTGLVNFAYLKSLCRSVVKYKPVKVLDCKRYYSHIHLYFLQSTVQLILVQNKTTHKLVLDKIKRNAFYAKTKINNNYIYCKVITSGSKIYINISNKNKLNCLLAINIKLKNKCYHLNKKMYSFAVINKNAFTLKSSAKIKRVALRYAKHITRLHTLIEINTNYNFSIVGITDALCDIKSTYKDKDSVSYDKAIVVGGNSTCGCDMGLCEYDNYTNYDFKTLCSNINYNKCLMRAINEFRNLGHASFNKHLDSLDVGVFEGFCFRSIADYCIRSKRYCLYLKYLLTSVFGIKIEKDGFRFLKLYSNISFDILFLGESIGVKRYGFNIDVVRAGVLYRNVGFFKSKKLFEKII